MGQVAEGVASVVGGVAVACVRAAAAVAGAVGYAAPLLRRLATRLQEAVSRRLPPPPLPRPGREPLCRRSKVTAPLRLRSEVMGSRGHPLLWRWLDQQDLRQRRFWGPSYPRRRRCGVSGRSRNAAPATPTPTPTSTTAPTPPPRHRQPHRPPRRRRLQRRQLRRAPRPRPHTPTPIFMPHTVGGRLERKEQ